MVNSEPERTPQTAPDLEALRAAEDKAEDTLGDNLREGWEATHAFHRYAAAVEARVRAEEQETLQELANVPLLLLRERNEARAERDAARAEVERLRAVVAKFVGANHDHFCTPCATRLALARAAMSTEAAQ